MGLAGRPAQNPYLSWRPESQAQFEAGGQTNTKALTIVTYLFAPPDINFESRYKIGEFVNRLWF
jgi:hypothetical protein